MRLKCLKVNQRERPGFIASGPSIDPFQGAAYPQILATSIPPNRILSREAFDNKDGLYEYQDSTHGIATELG
jgi:hypothetical protein